MKLHGLLPILATPFSPNEEVDLNSLRRLIDFQVTSGADGFAVFGMASEGFALTTQERESILRTARKEVGDGFTIIAGINATSTTTAIEAGLQAREWGADALMVLPPYLAKPAEDQLVDFFVDVAQNTETPIMVQDAPGPSSVTIPTDRIAEMSECSGISAVKVEAPPTAEKVKAVVSKVAQGFPVLGGLNARELISEFRNGACGTMPACEITDVFRPIVSALLGADTTVDVDEEVRRIQPLLDVGVTPGEAWAIHKQVLVRRGLIDHDTVRFPARKLSASTLARLDSALSGLGL
ncbi:dihydrodipicolinate synthase family protein [Brevibacterium sediminis]|uniref:Dihydrodipicolinate synthase family protein n=1 Tax=Brevibacterium sediminis TaxID=1857024 RepID=A0A5C4WXK0_9MICO|nr:dihydrodipicolinate synthase family protein [Brevibacterium sediminis]TNM52901.1 dihydrodipicolinate synthase family protein [Brevibacterium sediminis]